jgi:hypothetical protein
LALSRPAHGCRREVRQFQFIIHAKLILAGSSGGTAKQWTEAEHNQQDGNRDKRHRID